MNITIRVKSQINLKTLQARKAKMENWVMGKNQTYRVIEENDTDSGEQTHQARRKHYRPVPAATALCSAFIFIFLFFLFFCVVIVIVLLLGLLGLREGERRSGGESSAIFYGFTSSCV